MVGSDDGLVLALCFRDYRWLATDLGRYIRISAVRTPPPLALLTLLTFFMVVMLFCFDFCFTDFYWLLLTYWLFTDWWTFRPKQKGYIVRRTGQNRHRGTQRPFLIDWLTFWLKELPASEDGLARTATEVHNDNFADQYFSWSAVSWSAFSWSVFFLISIFLISIFLISNLLISIFPDQKFLGQYISWSAFSWPVISWSTSSWSAFSWPVISWSVLFLIINSLVSIFPDQHFPDQYFPDSHFPVQYFLDQHFPWSAYSWPACSWPAFTWLVKFLISILLIDNYFDYHFCD